MNEALGFLVAIIVFGVIILLIALAYKRDYEYEVAP